MGSGLCLRHGLAHVQLDGGVIVDPPLGVQHAAMTVVGELVEAGVGDDRQVVADLCAQCCDGPVEDAVGRVAGRAGGVLVISLGDPEDHDPADPRRDGCRRLSADGVERVLNHARH